MFSSIGNTFTPQGQPMAMPYLVLCCSILSFAINLRPPPFLPPSLRFLRHVPVIYVDYPGAASLTQIYGTFNRAMLRLVPNLRAYAEPLTNAMVDFYTQSQVTSIQ